MPEAQARPFPVRRLGGVPLRREDQPGHVSNLDFLTYGVYELTGPIVSGAVLASGRGGVVVCLERGDAGARSMARFTRLIIYDVLYVPKGAVYQLALDEGEAKVIVCRATAENAHPVFHAKWAEMSKDESRIRHLAGKDVFLMFDVSEGADKLMAGYTIFEPKQRSWPPHNHTDQEEIYIFTQGSGAMSVYPDDEHKWFVNSVNEGDAVTIPLLNYHPVFSHDEELHFIWCIAGERYWVGDKNKDFMDGKVDKLTT